MANAWGNAWSGDTGAWLTAWGSDGASPPDPPNPGSGGASASGDLIVVDSHTAGPVSVAPVGGPVRDYIKGN